MAYVNKSKKEADYLCARCVRNTNTIKKVSAQIPGTTRSNPNKFLLINVCNRKGPKIRHAVLINPLLYHKLFTRWHSIDRYTYNSLPKYPKTPNYDRVSISIINPFAHQVARKFTEKTRKTIRSERKGVTFRCEIKNKLTVLSKV